MPEDDEDQQGTYLATLLALVSRQISPKYEPSLREVATSPFCMTMSTIPSWMKYIFVPIVPSLMMMSPEGNKRRHYVVVFLNNIDL